MKYYRKDWIMFEEIANEGGKLPEDLIALKYKEGNPDENKHIPYIEETENGYVVKVGKSAYHDNNKEHHIIFIEIKVDNTLHRVYLELGQKPEIEFNVDKGEKVEAHAFCNLHGLHRYVLNNG